MEKLGSKNDYVETHCYYKVEQLLQSGPLQEGVYKRAYKKVSHTSFPNKFQEDKLEW